MTFSLYSIKDKPVQQCLKALRFLCKLRVQFNNEIMLFVEHISKEYVHETVAIDCATANRFGRKYNDNKRIITNRCNK